MSYETTMAIETNDVDPVVGGVVPPDDQAGQHAAGKTGVGAVGAAANCDRRSVGG